MSISFAVSFVYVVFILPHEELVERWQIEVSLKNKSPDQSVGFFFFFFSATNMMRKAVFRDQALFSFVREVATILVG